MRVKDLMTGGFITVSEDEKLAAVALKVAGNKRRMVACVVDDNDRLKGLVTPKELLRIAEIRQFGALKHTRFEAREALHIVTAVYARDVMAGPASVGPDDAVEDAIDIMLDNDLFEVPVVDKDHKVIGEIDFFDIVCSSVQYLK
jgi:CBS domain-containing protein